MNLYNCSNLKVTEYASKNSVDNMHKYNKSINLPPIFNKNNVSIKNIKNSQNENSIMFKAHPYKQVIMNELLNVLERYKRKSSPKQKQSIPKQSPRKKEKSADSLSYFDKFFNDYKVS